MLRQRSSRRCLLAAAALAVAGILGSPGPARGQDAAAPTRVAIRVVVHHASEKPGAVDPAAAALEQRLRQDFRFQSLRVLESRRLDLALNETGSVRLPSGRVLSVKPRKVGPGGVLMRVEIEGLLRTSLRVPNRHQVVIGAERYEDGKLVVSLEPEY